MPRQYGAARIECPVCKDRVYPLEAISFEGKTYHKNCMKCTYCKGKVSIKGVAVIDGDLYCKPHFIELFKSGGGQYSAFKTPSKSTEEECTPVKEPEKEPEPEKVPEKEPEKESEVLTTPKPKPRIKRDSIIIPPNENREDESDYAKTLKSIKLTKRKNSSGDIFKDLKMRNLESLKKTIADGGVDKIFEAGSDGVTPIEYAFKANNLEGGRYMIQYLQDHVKNVGK